MFGLKKNYFIYSYFHFFERLNRLLPHFYRRPPSVKLLDGLDVYGSRFNCLQLFNYIFNLDIVFIISHYHLIVSMK